MGWATQSRPITSPILLAVVAIQGIAPRADDLGPYRAVDVVLRVLLGPVTPSSDNTSGTTGPDGKGPVSTRR